MGRRAFERYLQHVASLPNLKWPLATSLCTLKAISFDEITIAASLFISSVLTSVIVCLFPFHFSRRITVTLPDAAASLVAGWVAVCYCLTGCVDSSWKHATSAKQYTMQLFYLKTTTTNAISQTLHIHTLCSILKFIISFRLLCTKNEMHLTIGRFFVLEEARTKTNKQHQWISSR